MRQINEAGLDLVKQYEGFRATAYVCPAGKLTIGYGHVILDHEDYLRTARLNVDEALAILKTDMADAESAVEKYIKVELNDNQFAALCSFTFNLGAGNLKESTLRRLLNRGDYNSVPAQLNRWVYTGKTKLNGLVRRRRDEGKLFQLEVVADRCCCSCHEITKSNY